MSAAVVRGEPTPAQRYLDGRLRAAAGVSGGHVSLPQLIYHCMRETPDHVLLIEGATGERWTCAQIQRLAVRMSRGLCARSAGRGTVLVAMRNHRHMLALQYAGYWAGATLCLLEPLSTQAELSHFLSLVQPMLVVCDEDRREEVTAAVRNYDRLSERDILSLKDLERLAEGFSDDLDTFTPATVAPFAASVLLPTSGSTGLAKAAEISHDGLLAQLPSLWSCHTEFPRPTERVMIMSTAQWMTFTNMVTTCPVYQITLIFTTDKTLPTVLRIIQEQKPTWLLLVPGTAAALGDAARSGELSSLRDIVITGAAPAPAAVARLQHLAPSANIQNSYGMTESQGFASVAGPKAPFLTVGKIFNIFEYKIVNDDGEEVPQGEHGELYLKSNCIIKGYINNAEAYAEGVAGGGWWRTGDVFYENEQHYMFFVERKKFWFKYLNYHISPDELENVIGKVPGVQEVVVGESENGAAAAVVRTAGSTITRDDIKNAVKKLLIEYKHIRGGVAFVTSLPRTHSGKLHRAQCRTLIQQLVQQGECF